MRIRHAAFFDQDRAHPALLQLDSTGKASGPGAHHHHIEIAAQSEHSFHRCCKLLPVRAANAGRIFAARFRHVRTSAAFSAHSLRHRARQFPGVHFRCQIFGDTRRRWRRSNPQTTPAPPRRSSICCAANPPMVRNCSRSMPGTCDGQHLDALHILGVAFKIRIPWPAPASLSSARAVFSSARFSSSSFS